MERERGREGERDTERDLKLAKNVTIWFTLFRTIYLMRMSTMRAGRLTTVFHCPVDAAGG